MWSTELETLSEIISHGSFYSAVLMCVALSSVFKLLRGKDLHLDEKSIFFSFLVKMHHARKLLQTL